jgi:predicted transcriptional regulator
LSSTILVEDEIVVYDLVKEYLQKKPLFQLEEIINFINYRLKSNVNFNKNKITLVIKVLIKKKLILPGTKLVRDDILEVAKRVEIYDYITAMPGANLTEIKDYHEIGSNHVIWHLKWLEKFEFIRSTRFRNQKVYFNSNFDIKYDEVFFYLRNTKVKKIIKLLREQSSSINATNISDTLNIHYTTVKKYMNVLQKFNLLMEIDEEHKKEYLLNPDMLAVIQNVIDNLK